MKNYKTKFCSKTGMHYTSDIEAKDLKEAKKIAEKKLTFNHEGDEHNWQYTIEEIKVLIS